MSNSLSLPSSDSPFPLQRSFSSASASSSSSPSLANLRQSRQPQLSPKTHSQPQPQPQSQTPTQTLAATQKPHLVPHVVSLSANPDPPGSRFTTTHRSASPAPTLTATRRSLAAIAREKASTAFANFPAFKNSPPSRSSTPSLSSSSSSSSAITSHSRHSSSVSNNFNFTTVSSSSSPPTLNSLVPLPSDRDLVVPDLPSSGLQQPSKLENPFEPENPFEEPRTSIQSSRTDHSTLFDSAPSSLSSVSRYLDNSSRHTPSPEHRRPADYSTMHQTSSRLLRMTDEDRPFTKDFKDLFSTLMVSLPLTTHRIRLTKFEFTFTSEEAINNLGSLKFSQSNRMPDPKDSSRIVTTTTTTTFSMAKEMARSVCQRIMDARFIETADSKQLSHFPVKGALWQLTPKGMHILQRFCQRNGISAKHIVDLLDSNRNTMNLVILERDEETDKLDMSRGTVEVIFRRFAGQDGPNVKNSTSSSDSDSLNDYTTGLVGVKMAKERKVHDKVLTNTFTGKATVDWLMDCSTVIDRRETWGLAECFVKQGLMYAAAEDKGYIHQNPSMATFQPTKNAIYALTERGQRICGWISREKGDNGADQANGRKDGPRVSARDSNNNRLNCILQDPALRLLFREFLRYSLCEENLTFYMDVTQFTQIYHQSEKAKAYVRVDAVRETLAAAYGLYNAFLAPGSPCELNIDHNLRNSLASRMTRAVGEDDQMLKSLQEVVSLFEDARTSVFKLMSSDSVPKFMRDPKYATVLREHDSDLNMPARSYSPTPTTISTSTTLPERSARRIARP